jgi:hypothetical protein
MNSYNENLNATVVASLQAQETDRKAIESQRNASKFSLYYAEGAVITASENLESATKELKDKTAVNAAAVKGSNISNNLLASATQGNQYLKQSVTNTAVCAANVQVAANAIVRLASDLGSIFSIVNAADFESDIYHHAESARDFMNDTAYAAEVASQLAMEASVNTSAVSMSAVMDKSKSTNDLITGMLKVTAYDPQIVTNANAALASANTKQKLAEGVFEDLGVDSVATGNAYKTTNKELNLGLRVPIPELTSKSFTFHFDGIKVPYGIEPGKADYPVADYYIIVVKENKKATFSLSQAEGILLNGNWDQMVKVKKHGPAISGIAQTEFSETIDFTGVISHDHPKYPLCDSDGEFVKTGVDYVVFVLAVYMDDYKRKINSFDDYLSAPSSSFCMTHQLHKVNNKTIHTIPVSVTNKSAAWLEIGNKFRTQNNMAMRYELSTSDDMTIDESSAPSYWLYFSDPGNGEYKDKVEYRCIFLPANSEFTKDLLTESSYNKLQKELATMEYDQEIAALQSSLQATKAQQEILKSELSEIKEKTANFKSAKDRTQKEKDHYAKLTTVLEETRERMAELDRSHQEDTLALEAQKRENEEALNEIGEEKDSGGLGFFFDLDLAEQITPGNYTPAYSLLGNHDLPGLKTNAKEGITWVLPVGSFTTDNFGNPLIKNQSYVPVILSMSIAPETNLSEYSNALSVIPGTELLVYSEKNSN